MQTAEFYKTLAVDKSPAEALGFNPYYQSLSGLRRGKPCIGSEIYFDLASNDYLGLASDPRIHEAMICAVRLYGSSMCGTPIATGYAQSMGQLEEALARFIGLDAAVVFPSCYQANVALFSSIATRQDLVIVDHYAHASLAQGIKACGCKIKPFLHNSLDHLEKQLAGSSGFRQVFVVTESVFSTEGSIAPLAEIVGLSQRHGAIPVVDDSHGIGVLGTNGRGILEAQAVDNFEGIYTASLGKALANAGGVVAGKKELIEGLRYSCPGLIYSTALPPACIGGALQAIQIIRDEFIGMSQRLWANHTQLLALLRRSGFNVATGKAPIAAIQCGSMENTLALAKKFHDHRILATPFVPPSVSPGSGILRLILGAKLDQSSLELLTKALTGVNQGSH